MNHPLPLPDEASLSHGSDALPEALTEPGERAPILSGLRPKSLARDLTAPGKDATEARVLYLGAAAALAFALDDEELARELVSEVEASASASAPSADAALALRLLGAHEKLAERRRALARGNERAARALLDEVSALREELAGQAEAHDQSRVALRLLDHVAGVRRPSSGPLDGELVIAPGGSMFQLGDGPRVDLRRRRSLRAILDALVSARASRPGEPVASDELITHGWPGERMRLDAAAGRLYVAIRALRELGLRRVLIRQDAGYLLDPEVRMRLLP